MRKGFTVSMFFVFLLSSGAFATILQGQNFGINAGNSLLLNGPGNSAASSINVAPVVNTQTASEPWGTTASQTEFGALVQSASAGGMSGQYSVGQGAGAIGGQLQFVPTYTNFGTQVQDLDAGLGQEVLKVGGVGAALGMQCFVGGQIQFIITPFGMSANAQYVGVAQADAALGSPDFNTVVSGGIDVGAGQTK